MSAINIIEEAISLNKVNVQESVGMPTRFGINGLTPYIGDNGNWHIGYEDTGVKAEGYLKTSIFEINENGYLTVTFER